MKNYQKPLIEVLEFQPKQNIADKPHVTNDGNGNFSTIYNLSALSASSVPKSKN